MKRNFAITSAFVTVVLCIGYIVSFVKEAIIANYFGITSDVDAYTIAIQAPVLLFSFVSVAIRSVVIPLYSDLIIKKGKPHADYFISNLITIVGTFSLLLIVLGEIFAGGLIYLLAPGFAAETHQLAVELLRLTLPSIIFTLVSDIVTGLMNVNKKFILPSMSVLFMNVTVIVSIILLHGQYGISAACLGQVIGVFLQMVFLITIARNNYRYSFVFDARNKDFQGAVKMSLPVLWSISVAEVNTMVNRMVASFLFVGSVASLSYASKINGVFMTLFVSAISTIVFPLYAESTANNNIEQLSKRVNFTLSVYAFFLLPLMAFIFCYKKELITLAFARGAFDTSAIELTKSLLGCYVIGLIFMALRENLTKVFYSLKDASTPAKNATLGVILNIVLNLSLPFIMGVKGLAIATSITAVFISIRLLYQLKKKYYYMDLGFFVNNILKISIATIVLFGILMLLKFYLNGLNVIIVLCIALLVSILVYTVLVYLFRVGVKDTMLKMLLKKS